jgi:hypothetical protein
MLLSGRKPLIEFAASADKGLTGEEGREMVAFIALGVVMLIWILTWEDQGERSPGPADH